MPRLQLLASAAAVGLLAPASVLAQDDPEPAVLAEVVVTAQKREEQVQDVPIAITVLPGELLDQRGLTGLDDISRLTPSLRIESGENPNDTRIVMRGIAAGSVELTSAPTVGVYVDGVYMSGRQGLNVDLLDVGQIEVLRGPQGTLYGRNTAAGALNITTRRPTASPTARFGTELGNYDAYKLSAALGGPLAPGLNGRIALTTSSREGYVENTEGSPLGGFELRAARLALAYDNGPFSADLTVDALEDEIGSNPNVGNWRDRRVSLNDRNEVLRDVAGGALRLGYDFGSVSLTSITGYRYWRDERYDDLDDGPTSDSLSLNDVSSRSLSQELRLASVGDARLDWLVGLYGVSEEIDSYSDLTLTLGPAQFRGFARTVFEDESYAVFGQATYDLTETLKLTVGGRYTEDTREQTQTQTGFIPGLIGSATGQPVESASETDYGLFTGRLAVSYEPTPEHTVYGSISQGYRAGGSNVSAAAPQAAYDPEESLNYEVGYKGRLWDDRLQVSAAAYFIDYQKLQVFLTDPVTLVSYTSNSEAAESYGFEFEAAAVLAPGLTAVGSLGWTRARYTDFELCDASPVASCTGNEMQYAPDWTGAARVDYRRPIAGGHEIFAGLDVNYTGEMYFTPTNAADSLREALWLTNGEVGVAFSDGTRVALWGRNLTNEQYFTAYTEPGLSPVSTYALGLPRTWGVRLSKSF